MPPMRKKLKRMVSRRKLHGGDGREIFWIQCLKREGNDESRIRQRGMLIFDICHRGLSNPTASGHDNRAAIVV